MEKDGLVSVVIPAYNAESTLRATLASVRAQTYANLEIVVVDDGSSDGTGALARAEARVDPRIRVLTVENGGVAAARNIGIARSRGAFIAPIDSDDLWHPEKIARQMAAMRAGGRGMGYVYTFYRRIDAADRIVHDGRGWPISGAVFLRMLVMNFVGNGSSLLIRREAIEGIGGYETGLHRQGAQGSEDYLAQMLMARTWRVGVVPEYLTGYRATPGAMSEDGLRMARSKLLALEQVRARCPETPADVIAVAEASVRAHIAVCHLLFRRWPLQAAAEFARAAGTSSRTALAVGSFLFFRHLRAMLRRKLGRRRIPQHQRGRFAAQPPASGEPLAVPHPIDAWLVALASREEGFLRAGGPAASPAHGQHPGFNAHRIGGALPTPL
jgi:hypothetical protein